MILQSLVTTPMFCLDDFEREATALLPPSVLAYLASGAADERTLAWNREAFDNICLRPRVLKDVSKIDTSVTILGQEMAFPILLAPTALQGLYHPEGELATAKGAGAAKATYVVSTLTNNRIEEIAKVATAPLWFQLYINNHAFTKDLVKMAEAAGCRALCLTVDLPVLGVRNNIDRAGFSLRPEIPAPYLVPEVVEGHPVTWKDVDWLLSVTKLPVLLKGILNPEDAKIAARTGAKGIIVSNHGARDLDTLPATIDALPGVVDAVKGELAILMDGGIRRGTDVVKALAKGADAVLIGRPYCYGLATAGADGVQRVLEILQMELTTVMALLGMRSIAEMDQSILW